MHLLQRVLRLTPVNNFRFRRENLTSGEGSIKRQRKALGLVMAVFELDDCFWINLKGLCA